jgi:hypothetical protein
VNVSIHQPDYIPYIGYFYKISQSNVFVFLNDVQFSNDNMHHWNKIKTPQGELRLKIPVEHSFGESIEQVIPKNHLKWREKHIKTLEMNYSRANFFKEFFPDYKELLMGNYSNLAEMNITINRFICEKLGFKTKFLLSSEMEIKTVKEERVIDICLSLGGTTYISGNGAKAYQIESNFSNNGIKLEYTDYRPFEYPQLWKEFTPNLSVIDYIFNCGFDWGYVEECLRGDFTWK